MRLDEVPLLAKPEIHRRLRELMAQQKGIRKDEQDFSLTALSEFVCLSPESMKQCAFGNVNNHMQISLTQFFVRWDKGEVSFRWNGQGLGWKVVFHNPPRPMPVPVRQPRVDFMAGTLTFF